MASPWRNGSAISRGKKLVPVRVAAWSGLRRARAAGPSRVRIGL